MAPFTWVNIRVIWLTNRVITYLQSFRNLKFKFLFPILGNGHEITLQLVPGANLWCVLYHFSSLTRWSGLGAKFGRKMTEKQKLKFTFLFLGMIATKISAYNMLLSIRFEDRL